MVIKKVGYQFTVHFPLSRSPLAHTEIQTSVVMYIEQLSTENPGGCKNITGAARIASSRACAYLS